MENKKYISIINLNNEDLTIKDTEARASITSLNIGSLKSDVNDLKTDVSTLKTDNTTNKANISSLQSKVINFAYDQTSEKITITRGE